MLVPALDAGLGQFTGLCCPLPPDGHTTSILHLTLGVPAVRTEVPGTYQGRPGLSELPEKI